MPNNNTSGGLIHVKTLANLALERKGGITVRSTDRGRLLRMQQQFSSFRNKERQFNKNYYPKEDPNHNNCIYDTLETSLKQVGNDWLFTIKKIKEALLEMEIIDNETHERINPDDIP